MKAAVLMGCFLTALSLTETTQVSRPAATMSPADAFSSVTTTTTTTTTPGPTTTTTTTPGPTTTTTTPGPTNTTTPGPTNTTTPGPTTTTPGPTTTPTSTTAHPPTPTPPSNVTVGNYTLMKDKAVCVMALMGLQIRLQTPEATGTFIVQPQKTKTEGSCKDTSANLTLVFSEGFISFLYNKSVQDDRVYVNALSFNLSYSFIKGGNKSHNAENKTVHLFSARVGHSYSCRGESLDMGRGLFLDVTQDRMQAFNLTKANEFGTPDPCPADQPNYRVAVAVGVTLLVLLVVVLLVYLLGRRRRTDGYQSL